MTTNRECDAFLERLNGALDGRDLRTLDGDTHLVTCPDCQNEFQLSKSVLGLSCTIVPPATFAATVTALALADRAEVRGRRILIPAGLVALAASVVIAVFAVSSSTPPTPEIVAAPRGIQQPLADAREAIVSLTGKVADETLAPAQNLFTLPVESPTTSTDTAILREIPDAARAGIDPLVSTPRRALNLFIRDVGGFAGARKSDS